MASKTLIKVTLLVVTLLGAAACTELNAAGNTNTPSNAGDGDGPISGYNVSQISYELGKDPSKIEYVRLTLDRPADNVTIRLSPTHSDWYTCINTDRYNWKCDTEDFPVTLATELRVVATGQ